MVPSIGKRDMSGCAMSRLRTAGSNNELLLVAGSATVLLSVHLRYQTINDDWTGDAFGLRLEVGENAVRKHRVRDRFQIFRPNEIAPLQNRVRLGSTNQILHRTRTRAPG